MDFLWFQRADLGLMSGRNKAGEMEEIFARDNEKSSLPNHCCPKIEWDVSEVANFLTQTFK
jgi:hypothetical protein